MEFQESASVDTESPARRRWWRRADTKRLVAVGAISTMAVVGTALAINPSLPSTLGTSLTAAGDKMPCYDMVSISIAGRNDVAGPDKPRLISADGTPLAAVDSSQYSSRWLDPVVNQPKGKVDPDSYAAIYVDYPANMSTYEDAVNTGVDNTKSVINSIRQSCPNTQFAIVGYSEGADVARRVAMDVGNQEAGTDGSYEIVDPNNVVGVVIFADGGREQGEGAFPGAENGSRPDGYGVDYRTGAPSASGGGSMPDTGGDFGALGGKVASFCVKGDLTCDAPESIALLQLAVNVGRQMDVDAYQRDGVTVPTALDMAGVIGRISLLAFAEIGSQENWMASDQTFLDVLVKVSAPDYQPATPIEDVRPDVILFNQLQNISYLPKKVRDEVVGFVEDNQNTIPVAMSDPYEQTLGQDGKHFDYWSDADPANGQPVSSAQYAADWLTQLAKEADDRDARALAAASTRRAAADTATSSTSSTPTSARTTSTGTTSSSTTSTSTTSSSATSTGTTPSSTTDAGSSSAASVAGTSTETAGSPAPAVEAPAEQPVVPVAPPVEQLVAPMEQPVAAEAPAVTSDPAPVVAPETATAEQPVDGSAPVLPTLTTTTPVPVP